MRLRADALPWKISNFFAKDRMSFSFESCEKVAKRKTRRMRVFQRSSRGAHPHAAAPRQTASKEKSEPLTRLAVHEKNRSSLKLLRLSYGE
ncbi:MAG: hypothetical protein ABI231_01840 [Candidatus Tumulicola sp.]